MNNAYDFKYLKSVVPIDRVLSTYGLLHKLTHRHHQLSGPCPLHGGDGRLALQGLFESDVEYGLECRLT